MGMNKKMKTLSFSLPDHYRTSGGAWGERADVTDKRIVSFTKTSIENEQIRMEVLAPDDKNWQNYKQ